MCLCRIDYDKTKRMTPERVITAYKVFREDQDGTLHNVFMQLSDVVTVGVWRTADTAKTIGRWGAKHYTSGFHASNLKYAEWLRDDRTREATSRYEGARVQQIRNIGYKWNRGGSGDPLQVTIQPPSYRYVIRKVLLRGVHTVGRQRTAHGAELRIWVAAEMLITEDV